MTPDLQVQGLVAATEQCPWCGTAISRAKFAAIEARIAQQEREKSTQQRTRFEAEMRAETKKTELRLREEADAKAADITAQKDEELAQQRTSLEQDRDAKLLKQKAEHNRDQEQLQQKIDALNRQLQRKTADQLGEGAELDVYEALRNEFPRDVITRIKKGEPGADISHEVTYKGTSCGTLLVDSKNRQGWQNGYVTKLREDQLAAKAEHAVLATTVFPSGRKELYVDATTKVIVVNRARIVEIVRLLCEAMINMHRLNLSGRERTEKQGLLYRYIASEDFRQHLTEATRLSSAILELDVDEKRTHDRVWEKRGKLATRLRNAIREVDTEVSAIIEGKNPPTK